MANKRILPGFGLSLGYSVFYLSLIVLLPLSMLAFKTASLSLNEIWEIVSAARTVAALRLSFLTSLAAAALTAVFGFLIAWVLARYTFFGKRFVDALIDLPFALPTAVVGIALATIYAPNGWLGQHLPFQVVFQPLGIIIALSFIGLPFVVRTVEPVIQGLEPEIEEAAECLGANRWQTFRKVLFPALLPGLLTGFTLSFARGLGEYGSIVFISGNMPFKTEMAPLLIMSKLEQFDYSGATAIALVMLGLSFLLLGIVNFIQWKLK